MIDPQSILPLDQTLAPSTAAEVAEAIRAAAHQKTAVYPLGGGSRLALGPRPKRRGLGLSLAGLNRQIDYPCRDLTVTVEAGMTVAQLAATLAAQRQRLPVDVPDAQRATVGGIVATGAAGPRRFAYGTIRDYLLGFTAIDGQGNAFSGGGRVVKNAAGYDMCKLLVGSQGTLGVLTQVTLMVRPLPQATAIVGCTLPDLEKAEGLLEWLNRSALRPVAVELLAGPAWQDLAELGPLTPAAAARLLVGFEGPQDEVSWMVDELRQQWSQQRLESALVAGQDTEPLWTRLTDFALAGPANNGAPRLALEIASMPSRVVPLMHDLLRQDRRWSLQAHAASGNLLAMLPGVEPGQCATLVTERLRPTVAQAEGRMIVTAFPPQAALTHGDVWGEPPAGLPVMRSIKQQFDPCNILNPGRYLFEE